MIRIFISGVSWSFDYVSSLYSTMRYVPYLQHIIIQFADIKIPRSAG